MDDYPHTSQVIRCNKRGNCWVKIAYFVQLVVEILFSIEGYLTKRISNDNVIMALEIRGHWHFKEVVNLIFQVMST